MIFWGGNFSFNNLVAKMAMHRLGLAVIGFSVPRHGFSKTVFGVRYLNRLYRDIENRYLKERLMSEPTQFAASLEKMREYLKANGVSASIKGSVLAMSWPILLSSVLSTPQTVAT